MVVGGKSGRGQREFGEALNNGIHAQTQICGGPPLGARARPAPLSVLEPSSGPASVGGRRHLPQRTGCIPAPPSHTRRRRRTAQRAGSEGCVTRV